MAWRRLGSRRAAMALRRLDFRRVFAVADGVAVGGAVKEITGAGSTGRQEEDLFYLFCWFLFHLPSDHVQCQITKNDEKQEMKTIRYLVHCDTNATINKVMKWNYSIHLVYRTTEALMVLLRFGKLSVCATSRFPPLLASAVASYYACDSCSARATQMFFLSPLRNDASLYLYEQRGKRGNRRS